MFFFFCGFYLPVSFFFFFKGFVSNQTFYYKMGRFLLFKDNTLAENSVTL